VKKPVRRPAKTFKPGQFLYYGGMVFEVDCRGKQRPRPDIGPDTKSPFKRKFTKRCPT